MSERKQTARKDAQKSGCARCATPKANTAKAAQTRKRKLPPVNAERIERWRRFAGEKLDILREKLSARVAIVDACAEIEGVAPVDLIVKSLERSRFGGRVVEKEPKDILSPEWEAYVDTDYERNGKPLARNNHEREKVSFAVGAFTDVRIPYSFSARELRRFARTFYRKGDLDSFPAFCRMVKSVLAPERA